MGMKSDAWLPTDERMAASGLAAFVEWLRAGGLMAGAEPGRVLAWARGRGGDFDAARAAFMGWGATGPRIALWRGGREAMVVYRQGERRAWTYDAVPREITDALGRADAVGLAAFHVLERDVHPDDRVVWTGASDDPLPLGALYVGATVIFTDDAGVVAAEGARVL